MLHYIKGTEKMIHDLNVCSTSSTSFDLPLPRTQHHVYHVSWEKKKQTISGLHDVTWHLGLNLQSHICTIQSPEHFSIGSDFLDTIKYILRFFLQCYEEYEKMRNKMKKCTKIVQFFRTLVSGFFKSNPPDRNLIKPVRIFGQTFGKKFNIQG